MEWQDLVMIGIGLLFIFLAINRKYEPALLLPLGFGAILMNLPGDQANTGIIHWLYDVGIHRSEAMPFLLFIGIGAMIDFTPLLQNPVLALFGLVSQAGIFIIYKISMLLGFSANDAASIGIIGAADGPTAILVSRRLNSQFSGQIAVAAYSYIALVPIIQPIVARIFTSKNERKIRQEVKPVQTGTKNTNLLKILFPIAMTVVSGIVAPESAQLTGCLMFGNLLRECGVVEKMADTARTTLTNLVTLLLGLSVSFTLQSKNFIQLETLMILGLGLAAFVFDIASGIVFVKLINLFKKKKMNPLIGSAGISAFPISSHVAQTIALKEDNTNIILMQATAANVSGQIFSAVIGGVMIAMVGR